MAFCGTEFGHVGLRFASLHGAQAGYLLLSLQGARNSPRGERLTNGFANARKFAPRLGGTHGDFLCVDGGLSLRWQAGSRSGVVSSPRTTASWSQARQTHRVAHRMLRATTSTDTTSAASVSTPHTDNICGTLPHHLHRDRARPHPHLHRDWSVRVDPVLRVCSAGASCMVCHTGRVSPCTRRRRTLTPPLRTPFLRHMLLARCMLHVCTSPGACNPL